MILKLKIGRWFENWMLILKNDSKQFFFFFFPQTFKKSKNWQGFLSVCKLLVRIWSQYPLNCVPVKIRTKRPAGNTEITLVLKDVHTLQFTRNV